MARKSLTRREFVGTLAGGAGLILTESSIYGATPVNARKTGDPFKIITLGKTGIKTTLLGMGTGFNGGNRTKTKK